MIKNSPHISRIISARVSGKITSFFKYLLIGVFFAVTSLNFYTQLFPENEEYTQLKLQTLKKPKDYVSYTTLAVYLDNHGSKEEAYRYFQLAQTLFKTYQILDERQNQAILGKQSSPFSVYQELIKEKEIVSNEVLYWEHITKDKPQFRDAYLQLAFSSLRLGLYEEAKKAIYKALEIDPLYPHKEQVLKLISG